MVKVLSRCFINNTSGSNIFKYTPGALKAFMEILVWKWVLPVAHVHAQAQWTLDIVLLTAVHLIPVLRMLYANVLMDMLVS